jgi:hypothetical protein
VGIGERVLPESTIRSFSFGDTFLEKDVLNKANKQINRLCRTLRIAKSAAQRPALVRALMIREDVNLFHLRDQNGNTAEMLAESLHKNDLNKDGVTGDILKIIREGRAGLDVATAVSIEASGVNSVQLLLRGVSGEVLLRTEITFNTELKHLEDLFWETHHKNKRLRVTMWNQQMMEPSVKVMWQVVPVWFYVAQSDVENLLRLLATSPLIGLNFVDCDRKSLLYWALSFPRADVAEALLARPDFTAFNDPIIDKPVAALAQDKHPHLYKEILEKQR